jgi:hypothetical protein
MWCDLSQPRSWSHECLLFLPGPGHQERLVPRPGPERPPVPHRGGVCPYSFSLSLSLSLTHTHTHTHTHTPLMGRAVLTWGFLPQCATPVLVTKLSGCLHGGHRRGGSGIGRRCSRPWTCGTPTRRSGTLATPAPRTRTWWCDGRCVLVGSLTEILPRWRLFLSFEILRAQRPRLDRARRPARRAPRLVARGGGAGALHLGLRAGGSHLDARGRGGGAFPAVSCRFVPFRAVSCRFRRAGGGKCLAWG